MDSLVTLIFLGLYLKWKFDFRRYSSGPRLLVLCAFMVLRLQKS
jgi:hypothetical protein